MFCAPTFLATSSMYAFARPPCAMICSTTSSTLIGEMSFAATIALCRANAFARLRPLPLPAPVIKTTLSLSQSISFLVLLSYSSIVGQSFGECLLDHCLAERDLVAVLVSVQWQSQIGGWVERIVDIQFILELSVAIIFDNGEVQMHSYGVIRVAGVISLIAKERAGFDEFFRGARRKIL